MRTSIEKKFRPPLENWELRCSCCPATYKPTDVAAANAHQNFRPGHTIVVYNALVGGIGPLNTF